MTNRTKGFTLAEVLITLAIIGVVAAITIPTLISNYHKSIVETRLRKASAVFTNAHKMSTIDYGENPREAFEGDDPDTAMEMFEKYYIPYIKFLKVEKSEKGVFGYLPDGAVVYFRRLCPATCPSWSSTYLIVCITTKACKNIDESAHYTSWLDGKDSFLLYTDGTAPSYSINKYTDEELIEKCQNGGFEACTALIGKNGWKIPDNYPIKF